MSTISDSTNYVNFVAHSNRCSSTDIVRRRLSALAYAATHVQPTVAGWCILHTVWREIEIVCRGSSSLRAEHERGDALLGGYSTFGRFGGGR